MFRSLKSRVLVVLVVWLAVSHLASLWLYARKHEEAASLLQDALVADRIALVVKVLNTSPLDARQDLISHLSSPLVQITRIDGPTIVAPVVEGTRPHLFEHLVGLFLDRPDHDGIRTEHRLAAGPEDRPHLLSMLSETLNPEPHHLPAGTLEEIQTIGNVKSEITLADGDRVVFTTALLSVSPFSPWKLWAPLGAMLLSVLLSGAWLLSRTTRPLLHLAKAAERLGTDIRSMPLQEAGSIEVRTAARAFNVMQDRIRRLIEDRIAFAAALAHDIGTPITRLVLRLDDLPEGELKVRISSDVDQMRRMVRATLDFSRMDFQDEPAERVDLVALTQSIADDMSDAGGMITLEGPAHLTIKSRPVVLRRAVVNVADNALKYGKAARMSVSSTGSTVQIIIDDDGPGIPLALQEEAFRPFRRLDDVANGEIDGTGLGLSVARSIVRSLGGQIALQNRERGGLRVILTLPA